MQFEREIINEIAREIFFPLMKKQTVFVIARILLASNNYIEIDESIH